MFEAFVTGMYEAFVILVLVSRYWCRGHETLDVNRTLMSFRGPWSLSNLNLEDYFPPELQDEFSDLVSS